MFVVTLTFSAVFSNIGFGMKTRITSVTSSSAATYSKVANAFDGDIFTFYSSSEHKDSKHEEWLQIDLGKKQYGINLVRLYPREHGYGFPQNFKIQYSDNGKTWTDVPEAAFTDYKNSGWDQVKVHFPSAVNARFIRLLATKLGTNESNNYSLQIAEVTVEQVSSDNDQRVAPKSVRVSSQQEQHNKELMINNHRGDFWSSQMNSTPVKSYGAMKPPTRRN
jgi:hypothetical protein